MLRILIGFHASRERVQAITPIASCTTTTGVDKKAACFISTSLLRLLITRTAAAKRIICATRRSASIRRKGQLDARLNCTVPQLDPRDCVEGEINSIIASRFAFCHHLITLSARVSTFGGIVRPICFAVFRLMINSNFLGCSTGRSAGLAPFKILSTYTATRR